jgi:hypothetical protein
MIIEPDPLTLKTVMRIRTQFFTLMRIWIQVEHPRLKFKPFLALILFSSLKKFIHTASSAYFVQPPQLLEINFDADPDFHFGAKSNADPAFHFSADPDQTSHLMMLIRFRFRLSKMKRICADPNPQHSKEPS